MFRFYNYLKAYPNIKLKIFVRDDIWRRITDGGFTEASHITKTLTIKWKPEGLLNLIILRFVKNKDFLDFYSVDHDSLLKNHDEQKELFYEVVPKKVLSGKNPDTFEWILSRISDGTGNNAPRELIHFFERTRELQIKRFEQGLSKVEDKKVFDKFALIEALEEVSKVRYEQTLLAEYPTLKMNLEKLKSKKSEQTITTLGRFWNTNSDQTLEIADKLVDTGFFKKIPRKEHQAFFVPFLYRPALNLVQGKEK